MRNQSFIRLSAIILPFFLLSGCMTTRGLTPPPDAKAKTWVVVSTMGNTANFHHIGFTVFNNVRNKINTTTWNLDAQVEEAVQKERSTIKWGKLDITSDERHKLANIKPEQLTGIFSAGDRDDAIAFLAKKCNCDYALVISPMRTDDHITLTNQNLDGYGVHQRADIRGDTAYIFANYSIVLLAPKTGTEYGFNYGQPWERTTFKLVKAKEVVPSPEELAIVEDSVKRFLLDGVIKTLATIPNN